MQLASFGAEPSQKAAMHVVKNKKETKMKEFTITELFRMTRAELTRLDHQTAVAISQLPEYSAERATAQINQRLIRRELARRDFGPC